MPLGSSSAAPVMTPGPRNLVRLFRDTAMENVASDPRLPSELAERLGTVEFADVAHMRDEPCAGPPLMQRDRRRLHHHGECGMLVQVERRLVRGAGRDRGHGAGPAHLDRPMDMAAYGTLDVAVLPHQRGQPIVALLQPRPVEGFDAAVEGWMMHEEQGRPLRL